MPIWKMLDSYLKDRRNVKIREKQATAEEAAREEAERPAYTPEELEEIRQLWSEPIEEKDIDGTIVTKHIDRYIDTSTPERLKTFAYYLLKPSFSLSKERARELAEIVAQNRDLLKSSFYNLEIRRKIQE
jgi:hypothetical protein